MGNSQPKLEKKFASLPAQVFPTSEREAANSENVRRSLRRSLRRAKKKKHEFSYDMRRASANPKRKIPHKVPLLDTVETLFLPEYSVNGHISERHFEVKEVIAKGAFGNVLKVLRWNDNKPFAMKVMKKHQVLEEGAVKQCKDEASIQAAVSSHPFIVEPHWFFQNRDFVFIVMEYIPRGELFAFWKQYDLFSEDLVRIYAAELGMVLDYLHMSGIIYRDLKMENILIDTEGDKIGTRKSNYSFFVIVDKYQGPCHIKVIDFGLAKWLKKSQKTSTICGTLQYIAPEILSLRPYGHTSDWWSLGILIYTLLVGHYPVKGAENHIQMRYMIEGHLYDLPEDGYYSEPCRDCVRMLLQKLPQTRICSMKALRRHIFIRDVNLESLYNRQFSPNKLIIELERHQREMTLSRSNSLADGLDDSLIHYGDLTFAWNQSVASLDAVDV
ncbi:hypothetical protein LSH36_474g04043 [Paralvinella palmiformis]|uniref:Protein kinase domain-containing protein n=1 Tax=Paralvinella palmiformis TaxID=53620 RepID=A0AAD9MZP6_9ANNE|nr:hypothetical protein LSH36_474g04043 [Paralvinella palmiformis]